MEPGKDKVVTGSRTTKFQELLNKVLPEARKAQAHHRMAEPSTGETDRTDTGGREA